MPWPVAPVSATDVPRVICAPVVGGRVSFDGTPLSAGFGGVLAGVLAGIAITLALGGVAGGIGSARFGFGATCSTGRAPAETMPPERAPNEPPRLIVIRIGWGCGFTSQSVGTANSTATVAKWMATDAAATRPSPLGLTRRR